MRRPVVLDAGPLVALLQDRDQHHKWARAQFRKLKPPLLTCEAVLTEACFLVRGLFGGSRAVINLVKQRVLAVPFRLEEEAEAVAQLMARYANVPMSVADACLVRMAEQHSNSVVLTLDRDFRLYRMHGRQVIPTIMPSNL